MEYQAYARTLLRHWLLIAVLAVLAAVTAYAYSARAPRAYRATAQLSVTPSVVDYFIGEAVQRLLNNYALRLRSTKFAGEFAPRMRPATPVDRVAGKVRAVADPSNYRISIEVDDADPAQAAQIANAAATTFVQTITDEMAGKDKHDVSIDVLEAAGTPGSPISPRPKRDAAGAGVLGALIGVGLAFLLDFWDDTVKSAGEAELLMAMPVLGTIPSTSKRARRGWASAAWPFARRGPSGAPRGVVGRS